MRLSRTAFFILFANVCQLAKNGKTQVRNLLKPLYYLLNKDLLNSKNIKTNWQGLADKDFHDPQLCIVNIKVQCDENYNH